MVEDRIQELGYLVPDAPKPLAAYVPAKRSGNLIFTAGQLPFQDGELRFKGRVGKEITEEEGRKAAEIAALNCLSVIKGITGDLNKIDQVVKLTVFVNNIDGFPNQPEIANGASEFIVNIFGEAGKHARSAVGVNGLPRNASVEVEMVVSLKD
jgi:enamine deaminase RidA (YjgF/YER057c/UK114 family)